MAHLSIRSVVAIITAMPHVETRVDVDGMLLLALVSRHQLREQVRNKIVLDFLVAQIAMPLRVVLRDAIGREVLV